MDQGGFIDRPNRLNCIEEWIDDILKDVSLKTWNIFIRRRMDIKFLKFTTNFCFGFYENFQIFPQFVFFIYNGLIVYLVLTS